MLLPTITELSIVGVGDAGVANQERVVIRPTEAIDLGGYGLFLGQLQKNGMVLPLFDQFLWFGDGEISPPSWLVVYTGPGTPQITTMRETGQPAYTVHWGKPYTVFQNPGIVPVLFRFDAIGIGPLPLLPQAKELQRKSLRR